VLGVLLLALAASAVIIYYAGDEAVGAAAAFLHLGLGVLLVLPFGWHWLRGRRRGAA
jgi:Na+/proline symporter